MKQLSFIISAVLLFTSIAAKAQVAKRSVLGSAQVAQLDVTGKWTGKRSQFSWDRKSFAEVFHYEFDLKHEGNRVTGTTTIINGNGEYADMQLEGIIVGNKLHFAENEIKSAIRPQGRVWCFKSGELSFALEGGRLVLTGATPSYMEQSNFPCSGGLTDLFKDDNSTVDLSKLATKPSTGSSSSVLLDMQVFPNPFTERANIRYWLPEDAPVKIEVFEISGKRLGTLAEGEQKAGSYTLNFSAKDHGFMSGIFIVKMTVKDEVYSRQLVQMR